MFFLFFPSEKEGPCSTRPNHPVCGHTQPLLPVLPLKGSLGLGLDTIGEAPWRSLCTHTPDKTGRRGRERPPHVAGDVLLSSHHVRTPGGFLKAQGCSPRGGQHVVEAYGEDGQVWIPGPGGRLAVWTRLQSLCSPSTTVCDQIWDVILGTPHSYHHHPCSHYKFFYSCLRRAIP